jgi:hypothetical protein
MDDRTRYETVKSRLRVIGEGTGEIVKLIALGFLGKSDTAGIFGRVAGLLPDFGQRSKFRKSGLVVQSSAILTLICVWRTFNVRAAGP